MSKILLVEDDNNLREIYEARLQAEGYEIVSAKDGEEALVVAKNEKPDLVISDVMMPKISGFEMLDILRNTDGLKDIKTIMLTALGQAEDKSRADALGADRYLVKSQVTLEDIVKTAHELLQDSASPATNEPATAPADGVAATPVQTVASPVVPEPPVMSAPTTPQPVPTTPATPEPPVVAPVIPVSEPPAEPTTTPTLAPVTPAPAPEPPTASPAAAAAPVTPTAPSPAPASSAPADSSLGSAQSSAQEEAVVSAQIEDFINTQPATTTGSTAPTAPQATPVVAPTVEPTAPAPESAPVQATATDATSNDAAMQSAVDTLVASTEQQAERPSEVKAVDVSGSADSSPAPAPVPDLPTEATDSTTDAAGDGNAPVAHKKVIRPLDSSENPKPDINALAAAEEAKEQAFAPVLNPGANSVITPPPSSDTEKQNNIEPEDQPSQGRPGPTPPSNAGGSGFDPSNIAL